MSTMHSTFSIDRTFNHSAARVFNAFKDPAVKRRWFAEGQGWEVETFESDFRVDGREYGRFRFKGGQPCENHTVFHDIVPERRIVLSYTMTMGDKRISASLATIEFIPDGGKTQALFTEQGAFFDGADGPKIREQGWRQLLDKLAEELAKG